MNTKPRSLVSHFNRCLGTKMVKENKKITISDVSKETGISLKTLEQTWASSNGGILQIHVPTADKLCQYFNCKLWELISFEGE